MTDSETRITIEAPGSGKPPVETTLDELQDDPAAQELVRDHVHRALNGAGDDEPASRPDPNARFAAPLLALDFRRAPELEELAEAVLEQHGLALPDIFEFSPAICWLWKRDGGAKWSDTAICSSELHFHTGADVRIWVSAEHVNAYQLTRGQVEALVFHALCHVAMGRDKEGEPTGKLVKRAHDAEVFGEETERFGLWQAALVAKREGRQLRLEGVEL